MIIFIDSNILFNNWYLNNSNFRYLFNFAFNTDAKILISEIVCAEIDNKYNQESSTSFNSLKNNIRKYEAFLNKSIEFSIPVTESYSFKTILKSKTSNAVFYDYIRINNSILVDRAIKKVKPFQDQEKGFRDTLIWLSLLEYLKNTNEEVAFINNNSDDFYNKKGDGFNEDLLKDLKDNGIHNKFILFNTLHSFVTSSIDKSKHELKIDEIYDQIINNNESVIEGALEDYISNLPKLNIIGWYSRNSESQRLLSSVIDFDFYIEEGLEDIEIVNYEFLSDNTVYIELNFNIRSATIEYILPTILYKEHYDFLEKNFYDPDEGDDITIFHDYLRIDFNISYIFNKEIEEIEDFVINSTRIIK